MAPRVILALFLQLWSTSAQFIGALLSPCPTDGPAAGLLDQLRRRSGSYGEIFNGSMDYSYWPHLAYNATHYGHDVFQVLAQVTVEQIWGLSQKDREFYVKWTISWLWRDCRFLHRDTIVTLTTATPEWGSVWKVVPTVYQEKEREATLEQLITISPDGAVLFQQQMVSVIGCPFNFRRIPFDSYVCTVTLSADRITAAHYLRISWRPPHEGSHPGGSILQQSTIEDAEWDFQPLREWRLEVGTKKLQAYIRQDLLEVATVSFSFEISRRCMSSLVYFAFPVVLMSTISYFGHFVDPDAVPARSMLGLVPILIVINRWNTFTSTLPPIGYRCLMDTFFLVNVCGCALIFIEYVAVNLARQLLRKEKPDAEGNHPEGQRAPYRRQRTKVWIAHRLDKLTTIVAPICYFFALLLTVLLY